MRVYVNIDEILQTSGRLIRERVPEITLFEGSAVSDPVIVEPYTGSLRRAIEYFSTEKYGRFRFVTKFTDIDSLIGLKHNHHTTIRFSINSPVILSKYEHGTPSLDERLQAADKLLREGYLVGFLIAPIFIFPDWELEYEKMINKLAEVIDKNKEVIKEKVTLELISHRFTKRAKNKILEIFPETGLPMKEEERKFKYGQFGYGKYVYPIDIMELLKNKFQEWIAQQLPGCETKYFV